MLSDSRKKWAILIMVDKTGRNDPCLCQSGKKYKHCCLKKQKTRPLGQRRFKATVLKTPPLSTAEKIPQQEEIDLIARTHQSEEKSLENVAPSQGSSE